jgi:NADH:ubiquinone reductase (H+-translocating)
MEILIVGGGYIGMYTARRLERLLRRGEATVTVVDPRGYMTYQPFLAEAAGGSVEPRHVIAPLPRVLRHTRVLTGKIVSIDHASRRAVFAPARGPGRVLRYDVLVMAAGSVSRVLPIEGLAEYAAGFKTVGEAVHLRNHVLGQLAVAASADDPSIRAAALTFVVVGGGFAGVEALAELQGLADQAVRFHPALGPAELRWVLVEVAGRILPELDERLGQWTLRALRRRGVDVRLYTQLASAAHGTVLLDDGTELAAGTLGVGGRRAAEPAGRRGRPADRPGRPDSGWRGPGRHRGTGRVRRRGHRGGA